MSVKTQQGIRNLTDQEATELVGKDRESSQRDLYEAIEWGESPRCPYYRYHRDGAMRVDGNQGSRLHYEPNSQGEWQELPDFSEPRLALEGAADRFNYWLADPAYGQGIAKAMGIELQK